MTKQPRAGVVSKAKGRVCWRFAGCLCYGTLLPAQESDTTCYARTHKGNTKTPSPSLLCRSFHEYRSINGGKPTQVHVTSLTWDSKPGFYA